MVFIIIQFILYVFITAAVLFIGYTIGKKQGINDKVEILIAAQQKINDSISAMEVDALHKRIEDSDIERQLFRIDVKANANRFIEYIRGIRMPMFFENGEDGFCPIFWSMSHEISLYAIELILIELENGTYAKTKDQLNKKQKLIEYYKALEAEIKRTK